MKTVLKKIFTLICVIIALSNKSFCHEEDRIIRLKELNLSEEQTYIPVKSGQNFTIELEGNPTTGYSWFLATPEKLQELKLLKPTNLNENHSGEYYQMGSQNKHNEDEIRRVGVGGIFHFKFLAGENSGHEKLSFIYKRPWTDEGQIQKSISVKVVNLKDHKDL